MWWRGALREGRVNRIASIYGKEDLEGYATHKLLYADKERTRTWMMNGGLQLSTVDQFLAGSDTIVQTPADLVKYKEENNLSFSMEEASLKALNVLRTRADEREGERQVNDWQKQCELLGRMHDDKEAGVCLGKGTKMLGEMHACAGG